MLSSVDLAHFAAFGFVVLRQAVDPRALADELDRALADGCRGDFAGAAARVSGRYVPMMCERTPVSLALLDHFMAPAAELLGRPVLPLRAKGVLYFGAAAWHRDSERPVASVGFAAYLEPLRADTGALRVLPGSHRPAYGAAVRGFLDAHPELATTALPGVALATEPGDVIAFAEPLFHATVGGRDRRQWRVDYFEDPADLAAEADVRAYVADTFPPDWDGGHDVDRYPTYGPYFLRRAGGRPWLARIAALGLLDAATAQETFVRSQTASRRP